MSSLINIYSLPKKNSQKQINRHNIYMKVLHLCHGRITNKAKTNDTDPYIFYSIPNFILGMPKYDIRSCKDYITNKLIANGFYVLSISNNMIFITWKHIKFDSQREKEMEDIIYKINNGLPLLKNAPNNECKPPSLDRFRPIYDTPSTEKFLLI